MKKNALFFLFLLKVSLSCAQEKKPNVLFLVIEDTSNYLFPMYGNESIHTPNLDWLAENGVVFDNAFANAPYCSPARSTLISGTQATVYGNDIHRQKHIQKEQYFLVKKLRDTGYFTVNKTKTDYNITGKESKELVDKTWSMNGKDATYNDASRNGKPFFGQFNNLSTHMSRITTVTIDKRLECKVNPETIELPPHVPDLPEMRADYALHLEGVQDIDKWVGFFLKDLKDRSLLEDTIIFFFSDHGGCLPRGKAFPFDTGYRVPLVVYAPEKYKNMLPTRPGERTDRMVSFDDFIPTVMSIAGLKKPAYVTGKPFMGKYEETPREYVETFRTNTGSHFDASRSVFDKRFQYIKYYTPHKRHALTQTFQWQMPSQLAWDEYYMSGKASEFHSQYYEPHPVEALYDLKTDPWEAKNLAADPKFKDKLEELREVNSTYIREVKDLGFLSWEKRAELTDKGIDLYSWVRETNYPLTDLISLAEKASSGNREYLPLFLENLENKRSSFRFWAVSGILNLACTDALKEVPKEVYSKMSENEDKDISALAAEILVRMGESKKGLDFLMDHFEDNPFVYSSLENLWDLTAPAKEDLELMAANAKNEEARTYARSLLIKLGEMSIDELYEAKTIEARYKNYRNRVSNYMQNTP
ncbi:sulfatase family protein [Galbibacter mesophilus]|uniref:sulfatase family protein n=1 Tax=Galbibacter mesophilus TaxID=379069 RepID=UPI00191D7B56|nr:sulfatase [Galbibacter mesophilus]MCM5664041.1 sulfatase [Galbibacter mesophilus]